MARLRRQVSMQRLLLAVLVVAIPFALLRTLWQIGLTLSIGLLIPVFVSGFTWAEVGLIVAYAFVIGAVMTPGVAMH